MCAHQVILVNGKEFSFRSVPERSCTLFEVSSGTGKNSAGKKVANVTEKIQIQVNYIKICILFALRDCLISVLQLIALSLLISRFLCKVY